MIKKRVVLADTGQYKKDRVPKIMEWGGWFKGLDKKVKVKMVRNQSFLATIKEIISYSDEMDVTRVGIVGDMHSGKSTLALSIGHAFHTLSKFTWRVKVLYRDDLRNFRRTLEDLDPANYILIFDDVSFMKDTSKIEQEVTEIRHMKDKQDVKVLLIFNFHYPKALPPFLREFQFKYVTSIGTDNEKQIKENYGNNNFKLCMDFKFMRKKAITTKYWFERVGPGDPVRYKWREPFIPILFWNESKLRKVVSPTRFFMDKICSICGEGEGEKEYDEKTVGELCEHGEKIFGKGNYVGAIKLLLHSNGISTYGKTLTKALRWIEKERKMRNMPLDAFAVNYNLVETKTRLRAKPFDKNT